MSERANKFLKDYKKNVKNSNATEDIVKGLVEHSDAVEVQQNEEKLVIEETEVKKSTDDESNTKTTKKTPKKGEKKGKAGRKPFKTGSYKKITIDIPQEIYDAMQDFLGAFDNNMTSYIKIALTNDINEHYEEYVKKAKQTKDSTPMLSIKRK